MDPFEQAPEINNFTSETEARAAKWGAAMASDVPAFAGEDFTANSIDVSPTPDSTEQNEYDAGLADAAALVNYGLDAAAMQLGVETTIQKIKTFDASNSTDPIKDLYEYLGIESRAAHEEIRDAAGATKDNTDAMREAVSTEPSAPRTTESVLKAIADMKELIAEVEGADPAYTSLRLAAESAGMGYFEYAVKSSEHRSLSDLLVSLKEQKDHPEPLGTPDPSIAPDAFAPTSEAPTDSNPDSDANIAHASVSEEE